MAVPGKPGRPKGYPKTGGGQKGAVEKIKREANLCVGGLDREFAHAPFCKMILP